MMKAIKHYIQLVMNTKNHMIKTQRTVFLPKLQSGNYSLEFFVPQQGRLFGNIPTQNFTVTHKNNTEVHQELSPQFASLKCKHLDHMSLKKIFQQKFS